jgi:hypothetical protein
MKSWLSRNWWTVVIFLGLIIAFIYKPVFSSDSPIFIDPPSSNAGFSNLPIGDSAICSFKKDFNVFYTLGQNSTTSIEYGYSDDDPKNTVSFSGLLGDHPTIITNTGTQHPTVIYDSADSIVMVDTEGFFGDTATYRLYKDDGVLVYEDQSDEILGGPEGSLEMGYCQ